jgi:hypothetical protein
LPVEPDSGHIRVARYLVKHIPHAQLVEVPGDDLLLFGGDHDPVINGVCAFLTGERLPVDVDRIVTTVLFADFADFADRVEARGSPVSPHL